VLEQGAAQTVGGVGLHWSTSPSAVAPPWAALRPRSGNKRQPHAWGPCSKCWMGANSLGRILAFAARDGVLSRSREGRRPTGGIAVFAARGAYHSLMTAERILVVIGGAVIVTGLTAAIYAAFTMSNFVGVLGLLILVSWWAFSSRGGWGRDDRLFISPDRAFCVSR
jgi:hypothetical protein